MVERLSSSSGKKLKGIFSRSKNRRNAPEEEKKDDSNDFGEIRLKFTDTTKP